MMINARLFACILCFLSMSSVFGQTALISLTGEKYVASVAGFLLDQQNRALVLGTDKIVRLVDLQAQSITQDFRFECGEGKIGSLTALTASPDFKYFAVGTFGKPGVADPYIYIVDIEDHEITFALRGHAEDVTGLAFTADGATLLSTSNDKSLRIWNVGTGRLEDTINLPERGRQIVDLKNGQVVVALGNGQLSLVDLKSRQVKTVDAHQATFRGMVVVGNLICSGDGAGNLHTWSFDLRKVNSFRFEAEGFPKPISGLTLSKDGKALVYSLGLPEEFSVAKIEQSRSLECGLFDPVAMKRLSSNQGHALPVRNVMQAADGSFYAVNEDSDLLMWDSQGQFQAFVLRKLIQTKHAARFASDGALDSIVQWSTKYVVDSNNVEYTNAFDVGSLKERRASPRLPPESNSLGISVRWMNDAAKVKQAYLQQNPGAKVSDATLPEYLFLVANGKPISSFFLAPFSKYGKFAKGMALDNDQVLISCDEGLFLFSSRGELKKELTEQNSFAIAISEPRNNRQIVMTYGIDGVFRFWNRKNCDLLYSLLITEKEWVAWTPEGYYDCSAGAERLIGWQINNGHDQLADFQPLEYFHKEFHKPRLIRSLWQTADISKSLNGIGATKATITENLGPRVMLSLDKSKLKLENDYIQVRDPEVELTIDVEARSGSVLRELEVRVFDRHLETLEPYSENKELDTRTYKIKLSPGNQDITVRATASNNSYGTSNVLKIAYKTSSVQMPAKKLYVLGIGISDYGSSKSFQRLPKPVVQTKEVVEVLSKGGAELFSEGVTSEYLVPKTREDVFQALAKFKTQFNQTDMMVLYWAGHGIENNGRFYFVLPDSDNENLRQKGISVDDLNAELADFKGGKIVLIIDTCHAGRAAEVLDRQAMENARADGAGLLTIASASAAQEARDGLFGDVLIKGLKGTRETTIVDPQINKKRVVVSRKLDSFLRAQVTKLSSDSQVPISSGFSDNREYRLTIATSDVQ